MRWTQNPLLFIDRKEDHARNASVMIPLRETTIYIGIHAETVQTTIPPHRFAGAFYYLSKSLMPCRRETPPSSMSTAKDARNSWEAMMSTFFRESDQKNRAGPYKLRFPFQALSGFIDISDFIKYSYTDKGNGKHNITRHTAILGKGCV